MILHGQSTVVPLWRPSFMVLTKLHVDICTFFSTCQACPHLQKQGLREYAFQKD